MAAPRIIVLSRLTIVSRARYNRRAAHPAAMAREARKGWEWAEEMTERTQGLEHGLTNYGDRDFSLYLRRSFAQSMGYSRDMLAKPVIGIAYTGSGFNNCHRHFPELLEAVKRGVLAAGALPIEFRSEEHTSELQSLRHL